MDIKPNSTMPLFKMSIRRNILGHQPLRSIEYRSKSIATAYLYGKYQVSLLVKWNTNPQFKDDTVTNLYRQDGKEYEIKVEKILD